MKDCCKKKDNHEIWYQLNKFEDWEPVFIYCVICGETIEEY